VHTPAANTRAVVEYVFALLFDLLRPRLALETAVGVTSWKNLRAGLIAPRQLAGLTVGIVGLGKIGTQVARAAAALDMNVLYNDLLDIPEHNRFGAQPTTLEDLLTRADIVTIHVDERPSNRHLFGASQFARMKPDAILLNTARGFVVDAHALADHLRTNPAARAALDVHEPEPFDNGYPLIGLENAMLTPHLAAATAQAHANMSWVVRDVWRVLRGESAEFEAQAARFSEP